MKEIFLTFLCTLLFQALHAQGDITYDEVLINGQKVQVMIIDGDTALVANLEGFNVSAVPDLPPDEMRRYKKYRRYAQVVYPYALQAIRLYRENEAALLELNKRKRRKYVKDIQDEYEDDFKPKLKKLTRLQGRILVKMIERELHIPFYDLVKELRGGFAASYWNTLSGFYGYDLKEMYKPGEDKILDAVLYDYDVSYDVNEK